MDLKVNGSIGLTRELLQKRAEDTVFGNLSNWRGGYINQEHKDKVLRGYDKIMGFIHKGVVVQVNKIKGGL
jgi:hypothetical protein